MSDFNSTLTQARLKELLHYDPETGVFTRLVRLARMPVGSIADSFDKSTGYIRFGVDGKLQYAHRMAWLYMYGEIPKPTIDHINRIRTDNRITNLRAATHYEQSANIGKSKAGMSSKYQGVNWCKPMKKFEAAIRRRGTKYKLGYFASEEDAAAAYVAAKLVFDGPPLPE